MFINENRKTNKEICEEIMKSNLSEEAKIKAIQSLKNEAESNYVWEKMKEDDEILLEGN